MQQRPLYIILAVAILSVQTGLQAAPQSRIAASIDNSRRAVLGGNVHPNAQAQYDQGAVSPALAVPHMTMAFKRSATQQADLDQLLTSQQDPSSANYHHWLTPEEYGARFGATAEEVAKIRTWLEGQGFGVDGVARARTWIAFSGTAAQVQAAFQTELHHYLVHGVQHFANATPPSIPAAFESVVQSIHGLNNFRYRTRSKLIQRTLEPNYTSGSGNHYLAPDDVATIYNIKPLYDAGIDGSGQKLVVVGQTAIKLSDLQQFRARYNLTAPDPQLLLVPNTTDPGISNSDLDEADLDLEWSSAVARNASIIFVYSADVSDAVTYAIDQNLAPVVSMSYGLCEPETPAADAQTMRALAQQGNAQGITWFAASGDAGGADCDGTTARTSGLAVDTPASIPEVTGLGGTQFSEGGATYWNTTNSSNSASALSYIPETAWNTSAQDGVASATGGGASVYFSKPLWQTGPGVPNDGARDVPDISLSASPDHDGYLFYSGGSLGVVGGTSVPAPVFAGLASLLNQYVVSNGSQSRAGLGNMNPKLYSLAQGGSNAFHDVTTGDNIVTADCPPRSRTCTSTSGPVGYTAGPGYDQTTGLGSVDAYNLFTAWTGSAPASSPATPSITLSVSASTISASGSVMLTVTLKATDGGTPTGSVTFQAGTTNLGSATLSGSGGTSTASLTLQGSQLPTGTSTITAQYNSTNSYTNVIASALITVNSTQSGGTPTISGVANGASFQTGFAPGMILSIFGAQLAPSIQSAASVPLPTSLSGVKVSINGEIAPLYFVSPTQLNVQIPYDLNVNATAALQVNNNGSVTSSSFTPAAVAPGIFTDQSGLVVPSGSAIRGQTITLYITGQGAVSPAVATGAAPAAGTAIANLPKPLQNVRVTVGNSQGTIQFIGIPAGLVGVTQINVQIPSSASLGAQKLVVTVGTTSSTAANINITG